jgi:hypothetical protein
MPAQIATVEGLHQPLEIRADPSGSLSVSFLGHLDQQPEWGWLHRASGGAWTILPPLPVRLRDREGSTYVHAWTADANGPRGVMVSDDGSRMVGAIDTDPREGHLEPIERSASGWTVGRDIPGATGGLTCVHARDGSAEAMCITGLPSGNNYPAPAILRYRIADGWQLGPGLDRGVDADTLGNYLYLKSLAQDAGGRALAVWERGFSGLSGPFHVAFHTYDPATGWSPLGKIPYVADEFSGNAVALGDGKFLLAHVVCDKGASEWVCAPATSRYEPASGWQVPVELSPRVPVLRIDGNGNADHPHALTAPRLYSGPGQHALIVWSVDDEVWTRFYSPVGGWAEAVRADAHMQLAGGMRTATIDATGRVTALTASGLFRFDAAGAWQPVHPVPWPADAPPAVYTDAAGAITVIWGVQQPSAQGAGKTTFFSARYK